MHHGSLPMAAAQIRGGKDAPNLTGEVRFYQRADHVLVAARISGLPRDNGSGFFALHIHEGGACEGEDFSDTGGHFNPGMTPHPLHAGDLPPLLSRSGSACLEVETDRFSVEDVIGKTVVIHSGPDDFKSQPAGNSGTKIACGVITAAV